MREIIIDTETTGLDPKSGHRVVEIGCVEIINRAKTGKIFHTYINPKRDMPNEAFAIHGIAAEFLTDKPIFEKISDDFLGFIGNDRLIIHNAKFDINFLNHEFGLINKPKLLFTRVLDTLDLARRKFPGSPASLNALCKKFNINLDIRDKHGALIDAHLLAEVYIKLTGGEQIKLDFTNNEFQKNKLVENESIKIKYKKREFLPNEEELATHKKLVAKINSPIWNE